MKAIEKTGKTVDDAIATALAELHLNKEDVTIEVLTKGSRGILGFGVKDAKIRISYDQEDEKQIGEELIEAVNKEVSIETSELSNQNILVETIAIDKKATEDNIDKVEQRAICFLQKFLQEIQIKGNITVTKKSDSFIGICLEGENMGILIGKKGETLDAIQYLVNIIANKGRQQYIKILVDTENYRAEREQALKDLVAEMSKRVKQSHKPVMLEPMNPYDRRIVHSTLQEDPLVKTYSEGKDPFRKVIIIPSDLSKN